ncbi:MAG: hypothetical protein ACREU2_10680 [Steroidobacteraceae bacterium]
MPKAVLSKVIGILALALCFGVAAHAGAPDLVRVQGVTAMPAPEIDPASAIAGLTLLLGGLAMVRGRRIKK